MIINKTVNLKLGCDPEVFVIENATGDFVPAYGLIQGTKEAPQAVNKGMVQVDGLALEFGIDPADNEEEFVTNIQTVMTQLKSMLPKGLSLKLCPTAVFNQGLLDQLPPEALELGCDPDYNAYTGQQNPRPVAPANMRSAGGHVHFGWCSLKNQFTKQHLAECAALTNHLDKWLGSTSLMWDKDNLRRTIYGRAGAFRPKVYGMEYRTLSNMWLTEERLIRLVYRASIRAFSELLRVSAASDKFSKDFQLINQAETSHETVTKHFKEVANVCLIQ